MEYGYSMRWPALTPAVKWLLIANTAVFVLHAIVVGITQEPGLLARWLGSSPANLIEGYGLGVVRLFTYQFVHSFGDPLHFLGNMMILYFFGTMVEGGIGRRRFFALYFLGGIVGALVEAGIWLLAQRGGVVIGASGACFATMVYAACMAPRAMVIVLVFPVRLGVLVWVLVGIGAYMLYVNTIFPGDRTAHGCHLGGALWGYLAYRYRLDPSRWLDRVAQARVTRQATNLVRDQQVMDELLEKVHRGGIGSLTPAERRFLDRQSRNLRDR